MNSAAGPTCPNEIADLSIEVHRSQQFLAAKDNPKSEAHIRLNYR
jgi:hypothetical protein